MTKTFKRDIAREARVLDLRRQGRTFRQIAEELGISEAAAFRAVERAVAEVYRRPAQELAAQIATDLGGEVESSKGLLARLRRRLEALPDEELAKREVRGLVREVTLASSGLERCLATLARIAGAEAPRRLEVGLTVDVQIVRGVLLRVLADHADGDALLACFNGALADAVGQAAPVAAIEEQAAIEVGDGNAKAGDECAIDGALDDGPKARAMAPVERAAPDFSSKQSENMR